MCSKPNPKPTRRVMKRNSLVIAGLTGVFGALLITGAAIYAVAGGYLTPPISAPVWSWGLFLFLFTFSALEIPVMIFGLRQMAKSPNPQARYVTLFTVAAFTFFAGVYAIPFILLAGSSRLTLLAGAGLAALGGVRFIAAVVLLPNEE